MKIRRGDNFSLTVISELHINLGFSRFANVQCQMRIGYGFTVNSVIDLFKFDDLRHVAGVRTLPKVCKSAAKSLFAIDWI